MLPRRDGADHQEDRVDCASAKVIEDIRQVFWLDMLQDIGADDEIGWFWDLGDFGDGGIIADDRQARQVMSEGLGAGAVIEDRRGPDPYGEGGDDTRPS